MKTKVDSFSPPTAPGLYWAAGGGYSFYNMIVKVSGSSPFFDVWSIEVSNYWLSVPTKIEPTAASSYIYRWGPKIEAPESYWMDKTCKEDQ